MSGGRVPPDNPFANVGNAGPANPNQQRQPFQQQHQQNVQQRQPFQQQQPFGNQQYGKASSSKGKAGGGKNSSKGKSYGKSYGKSNWQGGKKGGKNNKGGNNPFPPAQHEAQQQQEQARVRRPVIDVVIQEGDGVPPAAEALANYFMQTHEIRDQLFRFVDIYKELDSANNHEQPPRGIEVDLFQLIEAFPLVAVRLREVHVAEPFLQLCTDAAKKIVQDMIDPVENRQQVNFGAQVTAEPPEVDLEIRFTQVPQCGDLALDSLSGLRESDAHRFVSLSGVVRRASVPRLLQRKRILRCASCGFTFTVKSDPELFYELDIPKICPNGNYGKNKKEVTYKGNAETKGKGGFKSISCQSTRFVPDDNASVTDLERGAIIDFQDLRLQERMSTTENRFMAVPRSIIVALTQDLVGVAQPGDRICVNGIVRRKWGSTQIGARPQIDLFIEANHVTVTTTTHVHASSTFVTDVAQDSEEEDALDVSDEWFDAFFSTNGKFKGRSLVINSFAPHIHGMKVCKLAILLTLIGGDGGDNLNETTGNRRIDERISNRNERDEKECEDDDILEDPWSKFADPNAGASDTHLRSTPHLLLLGDSAMGKTQLLLAAHDVCQGGVCRSVYTTGPTVNSAISSQAGLTFAAHKSGGSQDGAGYALEAGSLVMADSGICIIDEFNTAVKNAQDLTLLHEAMEQQTVSIAKGGIIGRMHSRCSVLAACNANAGKSNKKIRAGRYDADQDMSVNSGLPPALLSRFDLVLVFMDDAERLQADDAEKAEMILSGPREVIARRIKEKLIWPEHKLRAFVSLCRGRTLPRGASHAAKELLQHYYFAQRTGMAAISEDGSASSMQVTVRALQSLLRLAQAHAKMMNHSRVELSDAVCVVLLVQASLQGHRVTTTTADEQGNTYDGPDIGLDVLFPELSNENVFDFTSQADYEKWEDRIVATFAPEGKDESSDEDAYAAPPLPRTTNMQNTLAGREMQREPFQDVQNSLQQQNAQKQNMPQQNVPQQGLKRCRDDAYIPWDLPEDLEDPEIEKENFGVNAFSDPFAQSDAFRDVGNDFGSGFGSGFGNDFGSGVGNNFGTGGASTHSFGVDADTSGGGMFSAGTFGDDDIGSDTEI